MTGKFYAVGVGPGDKELLTFKAARVIKEADIIVLPESGSDRNMAFEIAEDFIGDKPCLSVKMPMTKDKELMEKSHTEAAESIAEELKSGKSAVFLTIGDPAVYSTVMYVFKKLLSMGFDCDMVPGVPSFCAVAASLKTTLCERDEILHIVPATFKNNEELMALSGNLVLMKSGKAFKEVKEAFKDMNASAVERASQKDERVFACLADAPDEFGYFTTVLVKR